MLHFVALLPVISPPGRSSILTFCVTVLNCIYADYLVVVCTMRESFNAMLFRTFTRVYDTPRPEFTWCIS